MASTRLSHRGTGRAGCSLGYMNCLWKGARNLGEQSLVPLGESRAGLEEGSERVVGDLPVVSNLSMGYERLTLFFTDRRIIVGHGGKVGAGSVPGTFLFGSLGAALGGLFGREKHKTKRDSHYPSPGSILTSHKDNFSISYSEVVNVDLAQSRSINHIIILSHNDKFQFTSRSRFESILRLFRSNLGERVSVFKAKDA